MVNINTLNTNNSQSEMFTGHNTNNTHNKSVTRYSVFEEAS